MRGATLGDVRERWLEAMFTDAEEHCLAVAVMEREAAGKK